MNTKDINQWISRCGGLTAHRNKLKKKIDELEAKIKSNNFMTNCSFCGRHKSEVKYLIAGPQVSICNSCTIITVNIMGERIESDDYISGSI